MAPVSRDPNPRQVPKALIALPKYVKHFVGIKMSPVFTISFNSLLVESGSGCGSHKSLGNF